MWYHGSCYQIDTFSIDITNPVPLCLFEVNKLDIRDNAGIVDQDVYHTKLVKCGSCQVVRIRLLGYINLDDWLPSDTIPPESPCP